MKFVDEAKLYIQAGHGGAGSVHFRREKFVPRGGPDGGNGGQGGSVILVADRNKHTLLDFRFQPKCKAADGEPGDGCDKDGKAGEDLRIHLPVGTQILGESGELIADLDHDGFTHVIAKGGRGGRGNTFFKSATNRAPHFAQPGEAGGSGTFVFSLKLVADVGLIGFPNAGKSTLISRISSARPKIADYPFTTLTPVLGVVRAKGDRTFVVADIPGLIPDAHKGRGLGTTFLKHIERTGILVHLIDPLQLKDDGTPMPPMEAYQLINYELASFSKVLSEKPQLVVFAKSDAWAGDKEIEAAIEAFVSQGIRCLKISSVSGAGLEDLLQILAGMLPRNAAPNSVPAAEMPKLQQVI